MSPTNTGNGGGYTSGGYDACGGGTSYAIGNEHDEVMWGITRMEGLLELNEW